MVELRFLGVDDNALVLSDGDGTQYRVAIDEAVRDAVRPRPAERHEAPKVPPRAIQQLIRAGASIDEVVEKTGADRAYVARFEAPIQAERAYMVDQARSVPVRVRSDDDPLAPEASTFGEALDDRLEEAEAADIAWDAWKDVESGWHVRLTFHVDTIAREAVWAFDPKTHALAPRNDVATALSQHGESPVLGAPRLRPLNGGEGNPHHLAYGHAESRANAHLSETADLLELLRRRRGEREPLVFDEDQELTDEFGTRGHHRPPISLVERREQEKAEPAEAQAAAERSPEATAFSNDDGREHSADALWGGAPEHSSGVRRRRTFSSVTDHGSSARSDEVASRPDAADAEHTPSSPTRRAERAHEEAPAPSRSSQSTPPTLPGLEDPSGDARAPEMSRTSGDSDESGMANAPRAEHTPRDAHRQRSTTAGQRTTGSLGRRRQAMPSWDEIVFGTKRD